MANPTQNRIDRDRWGYILLGGLAVIVLVLLVVAVLQPGRTEADEKASADAIAGMDRAQAQATSERREAEKSRRSEFD